MCMYIFSSPTQLIESFDSDGKGIFKHKLEVERIQDALCAVLKHPTTIIDNDNFHSFINSARAGFTLNKSCDAFRRCINHEFCEKCDRQHANLMLKNGLDVKDHPAYVKKQVNTLYTTMGDEHIDYFNITEMLPVINESVEYKKVYLEYRCPIMGLRELIFPIFIESKVVGVFFVGQFIIKSDLDMINKIRKRSLEKYDSVLTSNICGKLDKNYVANKLFTVYDDDELVMSTLFSPCSATSNNLLNVGTRIFENEAEFNAFIEKEVLFALKNKEDEITQYLHDKRRRFINDVIRKSQKILDTVMSKIHSDFNSSSNPNYAEELLNEFKEGVSKSVDFIVNELDLVQLGFSIKNSIDEKFCKKEAGFNLCVKNDYYKSEQDDISIAENYFGFTVSESEPEKSNENIVVTCNMDGAFSANNNELYQFVGNKHNNTDVLLYLNKTQPFIFYVKYPTKNIIDDKDNLRSDICLGIHRFFSSVVPELTLIDTILTAEINERVLRLYRHEITHLTLGLSGGTYYTKDVNRFRNLKASKLSDIHQDNESCIQQLNYMTQNIGIFTNTISKDTIKMLPFYVFKEIFWKWDSLYKKDLRTKKLSLNMPGVTLHDKDRPLLVSDKERIEQIIYNLLNNAIKYSHINTNLFLDCRLVDGDKNKQKLTLINYGSRITSDQELPYKLYYRDVDLIHRKIEGAGVGLYIVKKTVELLSASIRHICEPISDYNVALFDRYLQMIKYRPNFATIPESKIIEAKSLIQDGEYEKIINTSSGRIEYKTLQNEIVHPTYKVTFEVII